ncbi:hypothetical protein ACEQPO_23380 [Bacillus sp. SL00103]
MIAATKKHQVCLMEAMKTTFLPNFLQIKQHIDRSDPFGKWSLITVNIPQDMMPIKW